MSTVQLAIGNEKYAQALAKQLKSEGSHQVLFVSRPDLTVDGIIVVDSARTENLPVLEAQPERFVVITRKDAGVLSRVWDAGVRHVVFEEDPPSTALLAVIAAELRLPRDAGQKAAAIPAGHAQKRLLPQFPELPVLQPGGCCERMCHAARVRRIFW